MMFASSAISEAGSELRASLEAKSGPAETEAGPRASSNLEIVPALVHENRFVHQRVPARDVGHALHEGAAVAHRAGLFHWHAVRVADRARRRLAFVPERPLGVGHELFGG